MVGDSNTDDSSPVVREDHEDEQQLVRDRWHDRKSAAMIWPTCLARKVCHGCEGGLSHRGMYLATVA